MKLKENGPSNFEILYTLLAIWMIIQAQIIMMNIFFNPLFLSYFSQNSIGNYNYRVYNQAKKVILPPFGIKYSYIGKARELDECPFFTITSLEVCLYFSRFNWFVGNHCLYTYTSLVIPCRRCNGMHRGRERGWAENFRFELILHLKLSHKVLLNGLCVLVCVCAL